MLRSEDIGIFWQRCAVPPDGAKLDFRAVWAWTADHAMVVSIGTGDDSRLYETVDGCAHWTLLFKNPDPAGFWDALAFSDQQHGVILGDPINGQFTIWRTMDGGQHWQRDESGELAAEPIGEGAFAASNSALGLASGGEDVFFGTGGLGGARIFHMHSLPNGKRGKWTAARVPVGTSAETAGVFSIAFRDKLHGVAVGGDFKQPQLGARTAVRTNDGGKTWLPSAVTPAGYRSAVAWDTASRRWVSVGPNGSDFSRDDGNTWNLMDRTSWNALSLPWAVGTNGQIGTWKEPPTK